MRIDWQLAAFATVIPILVLCTVYAFFAAIRRNRQVSESDAVEEFITARGSAGTWLLAFSFYAGAMGSYVTVTPAMYASYAGLIGMVMGALSVAFPILVVAYLGGAARAADPEASSLTDFLYRRFSNKCKDDLLEERNKSDGRWIGTLIAVVVLLNMTIPMLSEFAVLGILFRDYVGASGFLAVLPTLMVALLTMSYTFFGGLYVSILTDRVQGAVVLVMALMMVVYLLADPAVKEPKPALTKDQYGLTYSGYSSLLTQPLATLGWILMSEQVWQRVWASVSNASLFCAAWIAAATVAVVTFLFAFIGFFALWVGRADADTNPNLYLYAFFPSTPSGKLDSLPGLFTIICAALMAMAAVDSFQNGIAATLSSTILRGKPLWVTRVSVLVVNLPLAIFGATPYISNVLQLFLLVNLATLCCTISIFASFCQGTTARLLVTELSVVLGCLGGAFGLSLYGIVQEKSFSKGMYMAWLGNQYGYDYFLVTLGSSALALVAGMILSCFVRMVRGGSYVHVEDDIVDEEEESSDEASDDDACC